MERNELKAKIPHGYGKIIAERAGTTKQAVSQFLNGKSDNVNVEMATLEVLAEINEKRKALLNRLK
ncbi:LacI family DNA-binding transcriptional regulator [Mucilaginibacter rigui]|uniref:LacI family DNA-binding transcriptional regulator n=1 Tax=Mucilaginibacter rigui TaxID=534635 RepID=A0ABR7X568_9SPHI|nr:LacI family DNA-binding transcriptional regulator [Mucilaginibacter rigui]MBD1385724.1 LacI family DNA-binding transcriptional regulator [Mucilaginibacter rigui]